MSLELKEVIQNNTFVDKVRIHMHIDELEYEKLCFALRELAKSWRSSTLIDKELSLLLYSMPLMIRNAYLSFGDQGASHNAIAHRLEDIWVELDELVTECFSD